MANLEQASPAQMIEIGGKQRIVKFTLHSARQYKFLTGKSLMRGEIDHADPDELAILIWCGLIAAEPALDCALAPGAEMPAELRQVLDQLARDIDFTMLEPITKAIREAFNQGSGKSEADKVPASAGAADAPAGEPLAAPTESGTGSGT